MLVCHVVGHGHFFEPETASSTNIVLVVVVVVGNPKALSIHNRLHIVDNIIHNCTVTDFQVKS